MIYKAVNELLSRLDATGATACRSVCPVCDGGEKREATFSANLHSGVWAYFCHRAQCEVRGYWSTAETLRNSIGRPRTPPAFEPRVFRAPVRLPHPGESWHQYIAHRIMPEQSDPITPFCFEQGFRVLRDDPTTAAWIVSDYDGARMGWLTRAANKSIRPFRESSKSPWLKWSGNRAAGEVMVVEDPMSAALFAHQGGLAVALLGVHLSVESAQALPRDKSYHVALDADAVNQSLDVVERLRGQGLIARMLPIRCDIKDMPIAERLGLYRATRRGA